jgi:hypothetical protein
MLQAIFIPFSRTMRINDRRPARVVQNATMTPELCAIRAADGRPTDAVAFAVFEVYPGTISVLDGRAADPVALSVVVPLFTSASCMLYRGPIFTMQLAGSVVMALGSVNFNYADCHRRICNHLRCFNFHGARRKRTAIRVSPVLADTVQSMESTPPELVARRAHLYATTAYLRCFRLRAHFPDAEDRFRTTQLIRPRK